jgi:putative nucleotidyltransferase with HDIG domain
MSAKTRVLFVDDEPKILAGLRRLLHKMRDEWDMVFVTSGPEALAAIEKQPFDIVVTDMRMPGMDGAELLNEVRVRCPMAARLILSGHSDREMILKSLGPTHQFLAKPCDAEALKETVARARTLRDLLANQGLMATVARIKTLPSVPALYAKLLQVLESPGKSPREVAEIIGSDIGMTAKILQLVNSAFFGLHHHPVQNPSQAITHLGMDTVRAVVLTAGAFSTFEATGAAKQAVDYLYPHSLRTGTLSAKIALAMSLDNLLADDALMAGLLHDVGRLILAAELPDVLEDVFQVARERELALHEAERAVLGTTHAELGAYLLGLWGLPQRIVEAVAFHHAPANCPGRTLSVLAPVHVANALDSETHPEPGIVHATSVDLAYLKELGVADCFARWRALTCAAHAEDDTHATKAD